VINDPDAAVDTRTLILRPLAATVAANTIRAVGEVRVILIGGASGVGKSTTARSLAARLGWDCISTDRLARHPGRPWTADPRQDPVPDHVLGHYRALSVEELATRLLRHYEQLWPTVAALIIRLASNPGSTRLVLEGSGILPDGVATLRRYVRMLARPPMRTAERIR
jgi:2-phosphoglycerate kinase